MRIAALRQRIEVLRRESSKDEYGEISTTYTTVLKTRAAMQSVYIKDSVDENILIGTNQIKLTIRYTDKIFTSDRIKYRSKIYEITNLSAVKDRFLELRIQQITDVNQN